MRYVPLRHLSRVPIVNGLGLPGAFDDRDWPRYIRTTDIATPTTLRTDVFASQPPEVASAAMVERGDILITAAGSIGKSLRYNADVPACFAGFLVRVRPRSETHGRFLGYWCQSQHFWNQLATGAVKSTIENFSAGRYRAMLAPQPAMNEQRAIVNYLDRETAQIEALIGRQERLIRTLQERSRAVIDYAIIDSAGVRGALKLGRAYTFHNGDRGSSYPSRDDFVQAGVPFINAGHLGRGLVQYEQMNYVTPEHYASMGGAKLCPGDLLVCLRGSVGKFGYFDGSQGALASSLVALRRVDREVDDQYVGLLLSSSIGRDQIALAQTGSAQPNLSAEQLAQLKFALPSLERQRRVVASVSMATSRVDKLTAKAERFITTARERRAALITAAVTGQIDVRAAS